MATDKGSLLENEGNVQNAFPSQLGGHYERVGDKIVLWVWELVWWPGMKHLDCLQNKFPRMMIVRVILPRSDGRVRPIWTDVSWI